MAAGLKISDSQLKALRALRSGKPINAAMQERLLKLKLITAGNKPNAFALTGAGLAAAAWPEKPTRQAATLTGRRVRAAGPGVGQRQP